LNHFLIGTTDNKTIYEENSKAKDEEIEYLLNEVNKYFEKAITKEDILSSWSGIRPLVKNENKNETQQLVREHIITSSKNGLITIVGGKWTTYRKMAEDLVDFLVDNKHLEKQKDCETKKHKLFSNGSNETELDKLMNFYPISKATKESLKTIYGSSCTQILNIANEKDDFELINPNLPYLKAQISYCITNEFVKKPIDFLSRRIALCFVNKKLALNCIDTVCDEMGNLLSWDEEQIKKEKFDCKEYINNNF
jgi:glycerol-3-phosphate dehydrogenase